MYGNLRRAFEAYPARGGRNNILFFAAWMSHYVSDAHQPFHGIANYNGQLSAQLGVHARFEAVMFERFRGRLRFDPRPIPAVRNPRDFIFDGVSPDNAAAIASEVRRALFDCEPRARIDSVDVRPADGAIGRFDIDIGYTVLSTNDSHNLVVPFYSIPCEEG